MANPLYISQCFRRSGLTTLEVIGHGLTAADQGRTVTIVGVSEPTINGSFKIDKIVVPDTIRFKQSALLHDISNGIVGGACAIT
jgi:hypothetical protein